MSTSSSNYGSDGKDTTMNFDSNIICMENGMFVRINRSQVFGKKYTNVVETCCLPCGSNNNLHYSNSYERTETDRKQNSFIVTKRC
jgi:hypothetical protein